VHAKKFADDDKASPIAWGGPSISSCSARHSPPQLYSTPAGRLPSSGSRSPVIETGTETERDCQGMSVCCMRCMRRCRCRCRLPPRDQRRARRGRARGREPEHRAPPCGLCSRPRVPVPATGPRAAIFRAVQQPKCRLPIGSPARARWGQRRHHSVSRSVSICSRFRLGPRVHGLLAIARCVPPDSWITLCR